jgi:hypothetical protein
MMASGSVTTSRIDYLQRVGPGPQITGGSRTEGSPESRRLLRVRGIGRPEKERERPSGIRAERWRPATAELITGLYGYRIPLAFSIVGSREGVRLSIGTWSARTARDAVQAQRVAVIDSVLRGLYPVVDLEPVVDEPRSWALGGLALGVPAPVGVDEADGAAPIDRVIRSMTGTDWSALVLAYPVSEDALGKLRDSVINEMRAVESAAKNELAPSPLTEQYVELLKTSLAAAGEGLAMGAWRTAVYLLGDDDGYPRLATAWRSVMSGEASLPEPVRVFDRPEVDELARAWALPDDEGESPPGFYRRPLECQTLLSTTQLAACVHLPELEAPGFSVNLVPRFDVVGSTPSGEGTNLVVGQILQHRQATAGTYEAGLKSLTRHVFVAGLTGSGKTNTILSMLEEAAAHDIPFLVLEPAKTEYRALIKHPRLGERVRVFTAGKAMVAPFVLNPFEVPIGTSVGEHLNLLRAVFTASFGMWTPLPQILERCLHDIYVDRGWDLRTNDNGRLADPNETADAFPTISDLIAKSNEVIRSLGYEDRVTGDLKAALVTRLESLRQGAKGAMLDVRNSLPEEELFGRPTVVELEALGDEGDRAFFMGLLLIRLAEHRRARGQSPDLVHLLVIEEAHRLLANVPTSASEETANPRGEAVETFSNLLSEIRAYGQGVIIADQVPVRLAPDVMKNTNLKIAHRVVSSDDRDALAGAMAMDDRQAKALTSLEVGEAAVFSGGDDAPVLVRVPLVKDPLSPTPPPDADVRAHMARWRETGGFDALFWPQPFCGETCATPAACEAARRLADDEYVQRTMARTMLSVIDEPSALDRLWDDLTVVIRARRPVTVPEPDLVRAFLGHGSDWYATRRGVQGVWSYADTAVLRDQLRSLLLAKLGTGSAPTALVDAFRATAQRLHARDYPPYPACDVVCDQDPPVCLYRSSVADLVTSGRYQQSWREADDLDARSEDNRRRETWEVCQDAAYELAEFPDPEMPDDVRGAVETAARRICLCFEQQMLADDRRKVPRTARRILARVLTEADL